MAASTYLIALGSNRRARGKSPRAIVAAFVTSACAGVTVRAASRIIETPPLGPASRRYANAVALIESDLAPPALLACLKAIERAFGRRSGQRWGARALDLDIIGWSGGIWASPGLAIPHPAFRSRRFVLAPLVEIVPGWRDPVTNLTARQLLARLDRNRTRS